MAEREERIFGLTDDEVSLVRRAAVLAGAVVAASKYSGAGGTRVEFHAIMEGLQQAIASFPDNPLVRALVSPETKAELDELGLQFQRGAPTQRDYSDFEMASLNRVAQAAEVLRTKLPPERATEVRAAIVGMCEHVAKASTEETADEGADGAIAVRETVAWKSVVRALEEGNAHS